jgi:predicted permease
MGEFLNRLRARLRNRRFDEELREELRFHEEMKREALERAGMPAGDARAAARRALGNVARAREDARGVWIATWLESLVQDVRYGVRSLARQPLHAIASLTVLVLGIGLNTSLFTAFKGFALEPWPGRDPDRIVRIRAVANGQVIAPSVDEYRLVRAHAKSFAGVAAHKYGAGMRLRASGRAETYPQAQFVSANFLDVLGARMHLGAGFIADDDLPGERRMAAVISYYVWRSYFGSDPGIVGQTVTLNGKAFTVTGVLEERIDGLAREVGLWLPLSALASMGPVMAAGIDAKASANCCIEMMGRLAPGVDAARAKTELQLLHEQFAASSGRRSGSVEVYGTALISGPRTADFGVAAAFAAAVGLVLVLACANVGNLQLARGLARRRELATRLSIGASRMRIIRQLLVEGLVLAGAAGIASIGVAAVFPRIAFRMMKEEIPPGLAGRFVPDAQVAVFTAGVCLIACVAFALAPAFHATRDTIPLAALDRASTRRARFRLRSGLLATQIAACTVLLAGAGLVTRAIAHAMSFDPGFRVHGLMRVSAYLPAGTPDSQQLDFARQMLAELERELPGRVAVSDFSPLSDANLVMGVALPGEAAAENRPVVRRRVSQGYFDVLSIPLVAGRTFTANAADEAIVNEAFMRIYFRGESPLGVVVREVDRKGAVARMYAIVGVARDAYLTGLERIDPVIFIPRTHGTFLTSGGMPAVERIRATAAALSGAANVRAWPLSDDLREYLEPSRMGAGVAWTIGLLGLLLATVGVFGVFAYSVEERRREIGVRLALGAARVQIIRMLIATSGRAMAIGLGFGIVLSFACGSMLRTYLYGLSPLDPLAYGMVVSLLAAAASLATFIPARRACLVDPAITLREE